MAVNIANYFEADRISAAAGEAMSVGMVVSLENVAGQRKLMKVDAAGDLVPGKYGVVMKFSVDPRAVDSSTTPAEWGTRLTSIANLDDVVLVGAGAYIQFDAADLDASLDAGRGGAYPAVGDRLGVKAAKFSTMGAASAIITPTVARVYEVAGTLITVKITSPELT